MSLRKALFKDMSSVDSTTWWPPPRWAASTASSARRNRSVLSSRPGVPTATPMLTVRVIMWPSMARRSHSSAASPRAHRLRGRAAHRLVGDDDELVATEAGDHAVARTHPQSLGEDLDEPVARGVAEVVVDRLQPVEVEVQDG